jgi:hypothetical protein
MDEGLETLEERAENNSPTHGVEKKKTWSDYLISRDRFFNLVSRRSSCFLIEFTVYCLAGCTVPIIMLD